jgi:hypothetical protein
MGIDRMASKNGAAESLPLADVYRLLDDQREELDRRLSSLPPGDPARDVLWLELEPVLANLRAAVSDLARSQAADLPQLQAKAAILATLLRPRDDRGGSVIPDAERVALALSLADDVARLPGG